MATQLRYRRVVIKISGESLCAAGDAGIDVACLNTVADEIAEVHGMGVQLGLVVGAGNFIRGRDLGSPAARQNVQRTTADYMGMLGTVMNGLALRDALDARKIPVTLMSAIAMNGVCEPFDRRLAVQRLGEGRVVIFSGGTGCPFFTTDMCAALRAAEIDAEAVMKATKVDGVYDSDPIKNPAAKKYSRLTYQKVIDDRLGVMDLTAIAMCMENRIPILVYQLSNSGSVARALCGEKVGTLIAD